MTDTSPAFSNLSFETTTLAPRASSRTAGPNPFEPVLKTNYEANDGTAVRVTVPASEVVLVQNTLRRAADTLGIGVSIQITTASSGQRVRLVSKGGVKNSKGRMVGGKIEVQRMDGSTVAGQTKLHVAFAGKVRKLNKAK